MTFRRTRCPHCKGKMDPGVRIHPDCIAPWAEAQEAKAKRAEEKKARAAAKVERAQRKQRIWELMPLRDQLRLVQRDFNEWIRARDAAEPCISCGAPPPDLSGLHAGRDAGHYRSVGAASHLRFHPDNVHAQCVHCNQFLAGNATEYRVRLLAKIGPERLAALECSNTPRKWDHEQLRAIRDEAKRRMKEIAR